MRPVPTLSSALPAGGGFFLPSYESTSASASACSSSSSTNLAPLPTEPQDALRLSPVQLTRLRSHLDSRILSIQRRWAKRFHHQQQQHQQTFSEGGAGAGAGAAGAGEASASGSSAPDPLISGGPPLDSVGKYVSAWTDEVLPLLVRVDPVGASQSTTLVAYAMRMTELLLMGTVGYESLEDREGEGASHSHGDQGGDGGEQQQQPQQSSTSGLTRLLQALYLLDALWASLLAGRRLSLPHALARSYASLSLVSSTNTSSTTSSAAAGAPGAPAPAAPTRDSLPLSGSLGIKTLSGTDRVRLRNLLVDRRSEVRRWVGEVLGVVLAGPAPGEEEDDQELPGGGPSRLSGVARGSMPPMQGRSGRRKKRGRAALVESQDPIEHASQRDGIVEEVKEESDAENHTVRPAPAAAPAAKRRKRTRGDTKRATQIKEEAVDDAVDHDDDDEEEMEEVTVPAHAENGTRPQPEPRVKQEQIEEEDKADEAEAETEEHRHYQALFDRKIELDDDDDDDDVDDDEDDEDEGKHEEADEDLGQNEAGGGEEAADSHVDLQASSLPAEVNGNVNSEGNGSANGHGHGHADMGRLGSFELDVLLARLFSRSLALLERLE